VIRTAFNPAYLLDALKSLTGDAVVIDIDQNGYPYSLRCVTCPRTIGPTPATPASGRSGANRAILSSRGNRLPTHGRELNRIGATVNKAKIRRRLLGPNLMASLGADRLLSSRKLALLCSRACPGSIIVQTLDVVRALRETPWTVVSGFQSPTEQECLEILLRGEHPVIVCPARGVEGMRIPAAWKTAIAAGRMLITSPFEKTGRRATAATAEERNHFVVSLADAVFIPHASPGGNLERLCTTISATGKPFWTLDDAANALLVALGARSFQLCQLPTAWGQP
jgi:hypothetical protein